MPHIISVDYRSMLFVDGVELGPHLTKKEADTLMAVMGSERVCTKDYLLTYLYGGRDEPELKIVDVFVCKLRHKLGEHARAIQTSWGRGYYRHADYTTEPPSNDLVQVGVDARLLEDVMAAGGGEPEALITRLLKEEHQRLWSEAA